jgi:hypothetical protein
MKWWRFWKEQFIFRTETAVGEQYLLRMALLIAPCHEAHIPPKPANDNGWWMGS